MDISSTSERELLAYLDLCPFDSDWERTQRANLRAMVVMKFHPRMKAWDIPEYLKKRDGK